MTAKGSKFETVAGALEKLRKNKRLTQRESAAIATYRKLLDEQTRSEHYAQVPKGDWLRWSGRQSKIVNEQAQRYQAPLTGRTIDLAALARWLHDFLAANSRKLTGTDEDDPALAGAASPNLERYRLARAKLSELEYEHECGRWLPREQVHEQLARVASQMRMAGDMLHRRFGSDAQKILDSTIKTLARELKQLRKPSKPLPRKH